MKVHVILNSFGGTLRTTDLDWLSGLIVDEFRMHGHLAEVERVDGSGIVDAIGRAARQDDLDVLLVGGGDGTVSAAASALMGGKIALGIIPAGTMNLFARTLQIPLGLAEAVAALSNGHLVEVDIATVNGEPFVHQFAVGLHARMVRMRKRISYASRIGKMIATTRAVFLALRTLPVVELVIDIDGQSQRIKTPALAISNNLYGEGHLPYADDPRGGELGVYICRTRDVRIIARLALDIVFGTWRRNPGLSVLTAKRVVIDHVGRHRRKRALCDGELADLDDVTEVVLHPKALRVLAPANASYLPADPSPAASSSLMPASTSSAVSVEP